MLTEAQIIETLELVCKATGITPTWKKELPPIQVDPRPILEIRKPADAVTVKVPTIVRVFGVIDLDKDFVIQSSNVLIEGATPDAMLRRINNEVVRVTTSGPRKIGNKIVDFKINDIVTDKLTPLNDTKATVWPRIISLTRGTSNIEIRNLKMAGIDGPVWPAKGYKGSYSIKSGAFDGVANLKLKLVGFGNVGDCIMVGDFTNLVCEDCYTFDSISRCFVYLRSQNGKGAIFLRCKANHPSEEENIWRIDETGTTSPAIGIEITDCVATVNGKAGGSFRTFAGLKIKRFKIINLSESGTTYPLSFGGGGVAGMVAKNLIVEDCDLGGSVIELGCNVSSAILSNNNNAYVHINPTPKNSAQQVMKAEIVLINSGTVKWFGKEADRTLVKIVE